jgi:hypothetical protein
MDPSTLLGPVDQLEPYIELLILGLVVVNLGARFLAHRRHVKQAEEGGEAALSHHPLLVFSNVLLVLASFYYTTVHPHGGTVMSTLVVGTMLTDIFEFESRKVEARNDMELERPKGALFASTLVFMYAFYQGAFFIVKPIWSAVV